MLTGHCLADGLLIMTMMVMPLLNGREDLPGGINLGNTNISEEEKSQPSQYLGKWKHILSFTNLGNYDLVKYKVNLTDAQPIKEPSWRIHPALYTEIKENLVEMIKAGQ